ncbi:MAG: BREX-1 system adenine-specific DNA-methyltransferase PglX, partial [Fimbriimonadaceae bacterium]|nr:BREX-1 system adenine-specific DNA-methyltransferase PglX [Fimbriimonadaceae bacterium]
GWLYQFYISERKDEVFAGFRKNKKAGPDEIPAATQLFTPHWIVRYLVENSLGRLWMLNHPDSDLASQMDYYIDPIEDETDFLEITGPEELTVVDPACGSGHMLTYAFDLLYLIYEEQGYAPSDIPSLILTHNIFGTEIDPRAGALAAFAVTMRARSAQRTFFDRKIEPNICVIEPISLTADQLDFLVTTGDDRQAEEDFWNQFAEADTLGALIQSNLDLTTRLARHLEKLDVNGDLLDAHTLERAKCVIDQAQYLAPRYAAVVANPPYMGSKNMGKLLSEWLRGRQKSGKMDLYAAFIERAVSLCVSRGLIGMVTMHGWLFLSSYDGLRSKLRRYWSVVTLAHLGAGAFEEQSGEVVSAAAFVLRNSGSDVSGAYFRLTDVPKKTKKLASSSAFRDSDSVRRFNVQLNDLDVVPGGVLAYWLTPEDLSAFESLPTVGSHTDTRSGMATGDNERFLRYWWEVSRGRVGLGLKNASESIEAGVVWVPYNKGGRANRWYGNNELVVNWYNDGELIKRTKAENLAAGKVTANNAKVWNQDRFFLPSVTWSAIGTGRLAARYSEQGSIFDTKGQCLFVDSENLRYYYLALLNSGPANRFLEALSPTLDFNSGSIAKVPDPRGRVDIAAIAKLARDAVAVQQESWDRHEVSWSFDAFAGLSPGRLEEVVLADSSAWRVKTQALKTIEQEIDGVLLKAYGLRMEPDVAPVADLRQSVSSTMVDLASYAVGCMFGRYCLDVPGLILADQGATLEDYLAKVPTPTFMPDQDNVIPIVDGDWFEDDIVERFRQFLRVAFGERHFEENLRFVTESLGVKSLRNYFVMHFYKDHVKRYKKRPIYWMFSSPNGTFNALVYMHRYTPSTVSTVLNEYLREFQAKLKASLERAERSNMAKEAEQLRKALMELEAYEHDVLYPLASQNIAIDLDDGVKENYPKFQGALKKVAGLEAKD